MHCVLEYPDVPIDIVDKLTCEQNINREQHSGQTALHLAAKLERWDLVQILLEKGADLNIVDHSQNRPVCYAGAVPNIPVDTLIILILII